MKVSDAFPSNYLKAADLQGRNVIVKIDRVEWEEINKERKLALYFVGKEKAMILNKTNANVISTAYGDDTEDWRDQEIMLFMAMVDFQGKTVEALRVKIPPRRPVARREEPRRQDAPRDRNEDRVPDARERAPAMAGDDGGRPIRPMASADIDDEIPFAANFM